MRHHPRSLLVALALLAAAFGAGRELGLIDGRADSAAPAPAATLADSALGRAHAARASDVQVRGTGEVVRILRDDNDGSRHQRFILDTGAGFTVLVAHNIDLAPRVRDLAVGDEVEFHGEYVWTAAGGVIHWTHHDPAGRHVGGWLRHAGEVYE